MRFTHLHSHTHYSLLDGLPKISDLVNAVKNAGMDSIAITDHGVMYGVIEFYEKTLKAGIKPIIGVEAYMAPHSLTDKRPKVDDNPFHLILLAKNNDGYKNLMEMISIAHLQGFYYRPRIDKKLLAEKSKGIIALSGCLGGELCQLILRGDKKKIQENISEYQKIMGEGNFYLEVQDHVEMKEQIEANKILIELAQNSGIPLVVTKDFHYLHQEDSEAQDALLCVYSGKTIDDPKRLDMRGMDLHLSTPEEIFEHWQQVPEAIENTSRIADECQVELELHKAHFPPVMIPNMKTPEEFLREKTLEGIQKRFAIISESITQRLEYELAIILQKGYASYFIAVADIIEYAHLQGIVMTTRGSAAGSLVSYGLGITSIDPLLYKIPFERFLNPYRPSLPDIDMDFADDRRDEIIRYVTQKYGSDRVAQICTFGTMMARGSIRDIGRVLGFPYSFCDKIAKFIPMGSQGFPMTIDKALEITPELKILYKEDENVRRLLKLAKKVEGCARHVSVHAAGVVIAPTKLTDFTPLQRESGGENIITQYEMKSVEAAGLVKFDFLGIRNLSILGNAIRLVEETKNIRVILEDIPLDDQKTFQLLAEGKTIGLFQLNGSGMTRYLKELRPTTIHDIMAMVALYRPGPMESIPEYIRRKHHPELVNYLDPRMEKILGRSYGIITYQDDVLLIAIELAGYTWEEADKFRKAIGKKIPAEMIKQKERFMDGCRTNGLSETKTKELWGLIAPFAAYGFNKAHAASYGMVAYQTAYMKANFPIEYMAAILTAESGDTEKIAEMVEECKIMEIVVLPPSVNESFKQFTIINDKTIRFGLLAIKNIGHGIVVAIIEERKKHGPFHDLSDFLGRVKSKDLNKKSLESLIKSGAMDAFGERGKLLGNVESILSFMRIIHRESDNGQTSLFGLSGNETTRQIRLTEVSEASSSLRLGWEKELLGLYLSEHPFSPFVPYLQEYICPLSEIKIAREEKSVVTAGVITHLRSIITKKGDRMLFCIIEDHFTQIELIVFPSIFSRSIPLWEEQKIVLVHGKISLKEGERKLLVDQVEEVTLEKAKFSIWETLEQKTINNSRQNFQVKSEKQEKRFLFLKYAGEVDERKNQQLKQLFESFPGDHMVYFVVTKNGMKQKIRTAYRVNWSEDFKEKMIALVGDGNYKILSG